MSRKSSLRGAFAASLLVASLAAGCTGGGDHSMESPPEGIGTGSPTLKEATGSASARPGDATPGGGSPAGDSRVGGSTAADSVKGSNVGAGDPSTGTGAGPREAKP